ncbi:BEC protein-catalyzes hydroxylation of indole to indoxyl / Acyl-CoA dehydrogenase [Hydrogenophaga taeniospiralis CCUG 15921]|uniref:BEC protein-catalyzes hydroxylation of indole to indoxyl / Acyl-CoA dehydrogenase n=1 Tax=Hydrogenophaga taeniospiralis CCUG 15921 TaxID=1281780 RepID=A0A9X4NMZ1_9BURK|nr:acyl-CoA dehydrogenase family protein [Hydrogenophaga taeniospiralis]MDG5974215.1 BEC protein-catalyzes hydroxylation of indole to indoxyl / Acyl-CoA dehydrogenase [Hydrogenophaga taeniospiralis CCUG 15921]
MSTRPVNPNTGLDFTPAVGDMAFTPLQRELLAKAHALGRDKFAARAQQWDQEASFPFANYDDLRGAGFLKLCVPTSHGGLGADYTTYMMVAAEIGRFCGATALTWNMHICSTMWTGVLADGIPMTDAERREHAARRELHFGRIVNDGALYAQPFSEGTAAAAGRAPFGTTAKKVEGGWLINGRKIWASLSGAADYYGVLCTEDKGDQHPDARDTLYISVPATAEGFSISGDWDPLGMRGTVSRNLAFKDVFVSDAEQLMPRGIYFKGAQTWPAMFFTLSPTYLGVANAAYDFTVMYLRGEVPGEPPIKRRQFPTKQIAVAQMRIQLENMKSIFARAIAEAKPNPSKDEKLRLYAAHYSVMEGANDIARLAIRTCGGQSMLKHLPLERLYRDSRCGALMLPWTAELILDRMGRETLYEAGEKDE